jgi:signal transduction histidine kinase/CheY-like chemotaxis protein
MSQGGGAFLSSLPATGSERRLGSIVILISLIVFAAMAPFAKADLAHLDAFIPAYDSAAVVTYLVTTVLLFGQLAMLDRRGLLVLTSGYLFAGLMALAHLLSFPGLLSPVGWLSGGPQTTVWLYMFWHAGLPLAVLFYAHQGKTNTFAAAAPDILSAGVDHSRRKLVLLAVGATLLVVAAIVLFTTIGHDLMPPLLTAGPGGSNYTVTYRVVVAAICALSALCVVLLWRRKPQSVLDLWLMVVMCAWVFDIALSAMLNARRFDLGFYVGRLYGLLAASFILMVLLIESRTLFSRLAQSLERQRGAAVARAEELADTLFTLRRTEEQLRRLNETLEQRVAERTTALEAEVAERERIRETMRETQKLEAVGQMAGGIAHDFNNLLTIIMGNAGFLEDRLPAGHEQLAAAAITRAADRGARLVRQILTFSRRQSVKPEVIDLTRRAAELADLLQRSTRGDIRIVTDFTADLWPFECDVAELELALMNLCVNARDAMPAGGLVRIEARNIPAGAEVKAAPAAHRVGGFEGGATAPSDFVRVAVADTGTGIPPEVLAKVFEPFFTTKAVGKGTGLGLSQVYGFAQQAGGAAEVSTVPGAGTTVAIYLPRASAATGDETAAASTAPIRGGGMVLLVEDDDEVAATAMTVLSMIGYRSQHVRNAGTALALLLGGERFDLMLSDIVMPGGMNGLELARRVRQHFPWLPILLSTGFARAAAEVHQAGFELITKPYNAASLLDAINRVRAAAAAAASEAAPHASGA